ncbi:MAG: tRNA pseudouridine(38-40) synthase TruA, partial [Clostridia bacterium]|nr:tRNA pseudouridine(38-40) synthase TruA [Clostridia bacterium]
LPLNFGMLRIDEKINLDIMQKCASLLVGEHDFSALACKGSEVMSTIRTIYSADFKIMGDNVEFYKTGTGFLYKMVRNIMGVLLEVGKGKLSEDEFKQIVFEGKKHSNKTAPACALYLYDVVY